MLLYKLPPFGYSGGLSLDPILNSVMFYKGILSRYRVDYSNWISTRRKPSNTPPSWEVLWMCTGDGWHGCHQVYHNYLLPLVMTHLTGSYAVFGVVCEQHVAILLDCSASMTNHWLELTNHIELLLTEQLIPRAIQWVHITSLNVDLLMIPSFTIISFATSLKCFNDNLITVGVPTIVVNWMQGITPSGCTSMLEAIKVISLLLVSIAIMWWISRLLQWYIMWKPSCWYLMATRWRMEIWSHITSHVLTESH